MQFSLGVLAGVMIGIMGAACILANHQGMVQRNIAQKMMQCLDEKRELESDVRMYVAAVREVASGRN